MVIFNAASWTVNPRKVRFLTKDELLAEVKLSDFCGIGPRILRRLNSLGISTPSQLSTVNCQLLIAEFGRHWGVRLWQMGQGIDDSPLVTQSELPPEKSFGHSYTLPKWASDERSALAVLSRLSDQVAHRMRKSGCAGKTLLTHLTFESPLSSTPGVKSPKTPGVFPSGLGGRETYQIPINDGREIFFRARTLLKEKLAPYAMRYLPSIRHIGVWVTNLVRTPGLLPIFPADQKRACLLSALDSLWERYGSWAIVPADQLTAASILEIIPDGRTKRPAQRGRIAG